MWWFRLAILLLLVGLGACGFRPVKAARSGDSITVEKLAAVKIELIDNRIGQVLRNELLDRLNPYGKPEHPLYSLKVVLTQTVTEVGIQIDNTATRANLAVSAEYTLTSTATGEKLLQGRIEGENSYAINVNAYSTVVGEKDTQKRVLAALADDLALRLGLYFDRGGDDPQ